MEGGQSVLALPGVPHGLLISASTLLFLKCYKHNNDTWVEAQVSCRNHRTRYLNCYSAVLEKFTFHNSRRE